MSNRYYERKRPPTRSHSKTLDKPHHRNKSPYKQRSRQRKDQNKRRDQYKHRYQQKNSYRDYHEKESNVRIDWKNKKHNDRNDREYGGAHHYQRTSHSHDRYKKSQKYSHDHSKSYSQQSSSSARSSHSSQSIPTRKTHKQLKKKAKKNINSHSHSHSHSRQRSRYFNHKKNKSKYRSSHSKSHSYHQKKKNHYHKDKDKYQDAAYHKKNHQKQYKYQGNYQKQSKQYHHKYGTTANKYANVHTITHPQTKIQENINKDKNQNQKNKYGKIYPSSKQVQSNPINEPSITKQTTKIQQKKIEIDKSKIQKQDINTNNNNKDQYQRKSSVEIQIQVIKPIQKPQKYFPAQSPPNPNPQHIKPQYRFPPPIKRSQPDPTPPSSTPLPQKQKISKFVQLLTQARKNLQIHPLIPNFLILDSYRTMKKFNAEILDPNIKSWLQKDFDSNYQKQKTKLFKDDIKINEERQEVWMTLPLTPNDQELSFRTEMETLRTTMIELNHLFRQLHLIE